MTSRLLKTALLGAAALLLAPAIASARSPVPAAYAATLRQAVPAQKLVEAVIAANPDMIDLLMHVTPPGQPKNLVIAAHLTHAVGEESGDDDLGVMNTDQPLVEVQKDGVRIGVLVQMRDAGGHAIGALGLMYPYKPGDDQAAVLARSIRIRDQLAARIPSTDALFL